MSSVAISKYTKDEINSMFKDELKSHYLKREGSIGTTVHEYREESNEKPERRENNSKTGVINKIKYRFMLKVVGCLFITVLIMGYKTTQDEKIKNNNVINWIKQEYANNYNRVQILEKVEELTSKLYSKFNTIIPQGVYNRVVEAYVNKIKPEIMNFNLKNIFEGAKIENTVAVFNENIQIDTSNMVYAQEVVKASSQVSIMGSDSEEILAKNINIALPVHGTITSIYGAREEVFKNVGYHTGIDIANVLNTPVTSATDGKVVFVQEMDQYYGNNIEIEYDGVRFKYAHLNQINVSQNQEVKQGDIIGLMGSTGASTGSHLHFEIKINGRTVDPEMILNFR